MSVRHNWTKILFQEINMQLPYGNRARQREKGGILKKEEKYTYHLFVFKLYIQKEFLIESSFFSRSLLSPWNSGKLK